MQYPSGQFFSYYVLPRRVAIRTFIKAVGRVTIFMEYNAGVSDPEVYLAFYMNMS